MIVNFKLTKFEPTAYKAVVVQLILLFKDIRPIKEILNNHITDTNKKIDKLDSRIDKLETELKAGQSKLESKLDKLLERK